MLGWSLEKLAREAALAKSTLELFENGQGRLASLHADVLRDVLKGAGVDFPAGMPPKLIDGAVKRR